MADFPNAIRAIPTHLHTVDKWGCADDTTIINYTQPASRSWTAKLINYMPFSIPFAFPVSRFVWLNGSTLGTAKADVGIYSKGGVLLANTGLTTLTGASALQYATPTGGTFVLSPGMYYYAYGADSALSLVNAWGGTAALCKFMGMLQETISGTFALPATMTPATFNNAWGPISMGVTRKASGF